MITYKLLGSEVQKHNLLYFSRLTTFRRKTLILALLALFIITPFSQVLAVGTDYRYNGKPLDSSTNLYYYGQRYYNPSVGQFTQPDPLVNSLTSPRKLKQENGQDLQEYLESPQKLNNYSYTAGNPVIYTDPNGLDTALIIYGANNRTGEEDAYKNLANLSAQKLKENDKDNKFDDGILVIDGSSFESWQEALKNNKDISRIEYWGHGYESGLTIGGGQGGDYIVTSYDRTHGSNDYYIGELYNSNTTPDLEINLNTCNSATPWYNGFSVAQEFSNHFLGAVKGYIGQINYNKQGEPFVRFFRKLLMPSTWKNGGEKWFYPRVNTPNPN